MYLGHWLEYENYKSAMGSNQKFSLNYEIKEHWCVILLQFFLSRMFPGDQDTYYNVNNMEHHIILCLGELCLNLFFFEINTRLKKQQNLKHYFSQKNFFFNFKQKDLQKRKDLSALLFIYHIYTPPFTPQMGLQSNLQS